MISRKDFLQGVARLETAYNYKMSEDQFNLYYQKLSDRLESVVFTDIVERIIETESRFPSIALFWSKSHKPDNY